MKQARGFTLVELMISLAIFALLLTLSYQSVNLLLDAGRQVAEPQAELQQLHCALDRARSAATSGIAPDEYERGTTRK
ncbi:MAG: hypothetical protein BWK73_30245 [Thiothrix lacustris]|uniref:Prepilin-type N-terminal cleavage/methylation domain-containing protein n=1 Tax=Thiothrix lacustris TaxID=525917 RepID=A0A1Y1QIT6_9GAMM|nr:MAG: hypothetical protein BWK73_30245 [Thiothrix lacustris]